MKLLILAAATLVVRPMVDPVDPAFVRLVVESTILFGVYLFSLLFIMKQKSVYMELLRETSLWPVGSRRTDGEKV